MTSIDATSCCSVAGGEILSDAQADDTARLFKALGDPIRLKLLSLIAAEPAREACICDLVEPVGLTQGTVSHHMRVLAEAGLVSREQRGKWAYFSLLETGFAAATEALRV